MRLGRLLVGPKVLGAAGELLLNCRAALKAGDQTLAYHGAVVGGEAASSGSSGLPPVGKPQGSLCACLEARSSVKQGMCGSRQPPEPYTKLSSPRIGGVGKYVMVASEGGGLSMGLRFQRDSAWDACCDAPCQAWRAAAKEPPLRS